MPRQSELAIRIALADPELRLKLMRYAASLCRSRADAEDIVQDTLTSAVAKAHQLRDINRVTPWACSIARNVYRQRMRGSLFAPKTILSLEHISHTDTPAVDAACEHEVILRRQIVTLRRAIRKLPDQFRRVVHLRDIHEVSTREAADALGLSIDATKTRLHRARRMLRELYSTDKFARPD
jgi:RNA polymerase sigma-70 factor, ECF subfamily